MVRETVRVSRLYEGPLRSGPQCGRKRKSICSRSDLFCLGLSLVLYALPAWKELDGFNLGLFEDAIWYVYFLPGVLLAYYYGFRGSILNAAVSTGVVFITEVHKRSMHSDRPYPGLDDVVLMVGLTTLASLSVGFM
ncbi:MAG TPA: hypothetical protein GXX51_06315, partial [Firmicutes bacterium]|nr:hypothetical protein [Bacillota bacterium]